MMRSYCASAFSAARRNCEHVLFAPVHVQSIALRVRARGGKTVRARLHRDHCARARSRAGQRERSLAGEAIEHAPAVRVRRDGRVMLHLIEIEAGLLRVHQVDGEPQAVDLDLLLGRRFAEEHAGSQLQSFRTAHRRIVALDDRSRAEHASQRLDDQLLPHVHRERQRLQHELIAVAIDDHARQSVALAPDHSAQPRIHAATRAIFHRLCDAALEKIEIERLFPARETPRHDLRFAVVDRAADEVILAVLQRDDVAIGGIAERLQHLAGEDPVVAVEDARARFDDEAGHEKSG